MARVLVLPGDGIGPEVIEQAVEVLRTVAPDVETEEALPGGAAIDATGGPLPRETLERARACGLVLLGAVGGPRWDGLPQESKPERGLLGIRKELELYREALKLYRAQNWELAELQFVNLSKRAPKRVLYRLYIERINQYRRQPPPPDWDGVFTHLEK